MAKSDIKRRILLLLTTMSLAVVMANGTAMAVVVDDGLVLPTNPPPGYAENCSDDPSRFCLPTGEVNLLIPTNDSGICTWTYNIAWGDGKSDSILSTPGSNHSVYHKYSSSGFYTIGVDIPPGSSSDPNWTCGSLTEQHLVEVPGPNTSINTPPAPPSGSIATSRDASFTYTSNASSATFECSLDDGPFSDCTSQPTNYSNLTDGLHTFKVRAKDTGGYKDLSPATRTWTVDGTSPSLNITDGPDGESYPTGATQTWHFTASDATSGIASVQCSVVTTGSPASFGTCSGGNSSHTVTNMSSGSYTFTVRARDNGGHETTQSRTFSIAAVPPPDTTAPTVVGTTPANRVTGVARGISPTATFSEKMKARTINTNTFRLFKVNSDGTQTQVTDVVVSLSSDGLKATLNPFGSKTTLLARSTKYKGVVTTGTKDLAGNALAQQRNWTFTTKP